jgi:hypothetical protein
MYLHLYLHLYLYLYLYLYLSAVHLKRQTDGTWDSNRWQHVIRQSATWRSPTRELELEREWEFGARLGSRQCYLLVGSVVLNLLLDRFSVIGCSVDSVSEIGSWYAGNRFRTFAWLKPVTVGGLIGIRHAVVPPTPRG